MITQNLPTTKFTPVDFQTGERLELLIDSQIIIPRGKKWRKHVFDLRTGKKYLAWSKCCGQEDCLCDAYVKEVSPGR